MRQPMVALAVAFLLSFSGRNAWGQAQYAVTDLGALGGATSQAYGINASGQVVGQAETDSGDNHAFLYSGGKMTNLGTLGGSASCAYGINDSGTVVGYSQTAGNAASHAFVYRTTNPPMTDLNTLGGANSCAYAINNSEQIVGQSDVASEIVGSGSGNVISHAASFGGGTPMDLGTLGGAISCAYGINAKGNVVGYSQITGSTTEHAFIYLYKGGVNSTMTDLQTLGGTNSRAYAINDADHVVGWSQTSSGDTHAFFYNGTKMLDLNTLSGDTASHAYGLNNHDQIVGSSETSEGAERAFLDVDGVMTDLNSMIDSNGWTLEEARGINDNGQIVGWGKIGDDGPTHAFLLTRVPEPSTLILLGIGALTFFGYGWRRRAKQ